MTPKPPNVTIQKEIVAEDAMSKKVQFTISIPAYGWHGLDDALNEIQKSSEAHAPRSISSAKRRLKEKTLPADGSFSKHDLFEQARRAIGTAEEALSKVPEGHHGLIYKALNQAFLAGSLMTEGFMRSRHLNDVEREAGQKKARRKGGERKRGQVKEDTLDLVQVMQELIDSGKSKSHAADIALRRGLGRSADANRKIYDYHTKRK